jgi:hypothetical protein
VRCADTFLSGLRPLELLQLLSCWSFPGWLYLSINHGRKHLLAEFWRAIFCGSEEMSDLVNPSFFQGYIDVGGGLGIDYDGTKGNKSGASTNYSMQASD